MTLTSMTLTLYDLPADVILHDATLREIAARCPATLAELGEIPGLGAKKLEAYGEDVLAVVAEGWQWCRFAFYSLLLWNNKPSL